MSEHEELITAIADMIGDYIGGGLPEPHPDHVQTWIEQFDEDVQLPILRELRHVLKSTYMSRSDVNEFLHSVVTSGLKHPDPCEFWKSVAFLNIQRGGDSQRDMLAFLDAYLVDHCGFGVADCGVRSDIFVYLDDGVWTGNRVRGDLEHWLENEAPATSTVHVVVLVLHLGGKWYAEERILRAAREAGKKIELCWWRAHELENRRLRKDDSDVLWPTEIPNTPAVGAYVEGMTHQPVLRRGGRRGVKELFSSDAGRQVLEQEFLKAGVRIRDESGNMGDTQRPLGHMTLETLGFGSLFVTFRNCPNNAPLALWAGQPWYPLFPRLTNRETDLRRLFGTVGS